METIKQAICDAVWKREIDQESTREVANRFGCTLPIARKILMAIINGTSGDTRFKPVEEGGVTISDGSTFNYSPMDMYEGGMSTRAPKHYIWFAY